MKADHIYEYCERIANLLRADARKSAAGQQPVQLEALHYLGICNKYSNTPVAVAEYLGLTKGTVSQTLRVLEQNGLVSKQPDNKDRRVVHLTVTAKGRHVLSSAVPPRSLLAALQALSEPQQDTLRSALEQLLRAMQGANELKTFGVCGSCRHNLAGPGNNRLCGLTQEVLTQDDCTQICREHSARVA